MDEGGADPWILDALIELCRGRSMVALTGAGVSTDSGLPDYRGAGSTQVPSVDFDLFISDVSWRRWVWEQNQRTWRTLTDLEPSEGHRALAQLERAGLLAGVATQNVDGLHSRAGSRDVAELHGSALWVDCVDCGTRYPRQWLDEELSALNPWVGFDADPTHVSILAPADESAASASTMEIVDCPACGGILKPGVVFFGEALPEQALSKALALASSSEVLLVVGTSAKVSTAMCVVSAALRAGADLIVINRGPTDLDDHESVTLRIEGGASEYLGDLADSLAPCP